MSIREFQRIKAAAEKLTPKQKAELLRLLRGTNGVKKSKLKPSKAKQKLLAEFRQSWKEAMAGEYRPVDEFLKELEEHD